MTPSHLLPGALSLALLLAACGGSGAQPVARCATDPECGEGAYCLSGACRASAAPVASIEVPAPLVTAKVLLLQAVVADPDPADSAASHAWTVTRVGAACEAEAEPTLGAALEVVFWCGGTYDVTLVATDQHGVPSAPATRRVEVAESQGLPTVTASAAAASVGHRCAGQPLACTLTAPISLSATGTDPGHQPLTYRWSVRSLSPLVTAATAAFLPSPTATSAAVELATEGTAIAGDWSFEVRATNLDGYLARDAVVVRVDNRPPRPTGLPLAIDHTYQGGTYLASGTLVGTATDPDGDPVTVTTSYVEPDGTGCTGTFAAATSVVSVACSSANQLIGGVSREATITATDVNGAVAEAPATIQIRNRAPTIRLIQAGAVSLFRDHGVGPCSQASGDCYQAGGSQPFVAEDPDGDPITEVALAVEIDATAIHSVGEVDVTGPGTWRVATPVAYPLEFREPTAGHSPFYLHGRAIDPFQASAELVAPIEIGNRPPAPAQAGATAFANHRYVVDEYQATFDLTAFVDPDGDPMELTGEPGARDCADFTRVGDRLSVTCRKRWPLSTGGLPPLDAFLGTRPIVVSAADAWSIAPVKATTSATIGNRSPTVASSSGPADEKCICDCLLPLRLSRPATAAGVGDASLVLAAPGGTVRPICDAPTLVPDGRFTVDPGAADEDGDPLQVSLVRTLSNTSVVKTVLPKNAPEPFQGVYGAATWSVSVTDGAAPVVRGTVEVTSVSCPDEGSACL